MIFAAEIYISHQDLDLNRLLFFTKTVVQLHQDSDLKSIVFTKIVLEPEF